MPNKIPSPTPGVDMNGLNPPLLSLSLDWTHAVRAANSLVNDGWELPETRCHPAVEEELAAFLCAYGVLGDGIDRIRTCNDDELPPAVKDPGVAVK